MTTRLISESSQTKYGTAQSRHRLREDDRVPAYKVGTETECQLTTIQQPAAVVPADKQTKRENGSSSSTASIYKHRQAGSRRREISLPGKTLYVHTFQNVYMRITTQKQTKDRYILKGTAGEYMHLFVN